jgi:hypothetical protein
MKRLILLSIILTTLTNESYASFPIVEIIKTEISEEGPGPNFGDMLGIAAGFSIIFLLVRFLIRLITGRSRIFHEAYPPLRKWEKVFLKVLMWLAVGVLLLSLLCSLGDGCIYNMQ